MNILTRIRSWFREAPLYLVTLTYQRVDGEPHPVCYIERGTPYYPAIGSRTALGYLVRIDVDRIDRA